MRFIDASLFHLVGNHIVPQHMLNACRIPVETFKNQGYPVIYKMSIR